MEGHKSDWEECDEQAGWTGAKHVITTMTIITVIVVIVVISLHIVDSVL